jgi:peroxiredoxin
MPAAGSLEIGQAAPPFTLRGPGGQRVSLSDYEGLHHVVLAFYPLAFSPVCSHQLPALQAELPRFEALNATMLGISIDSWYANEAFARQLGLSFPLLSDISRETSQAYGVYLPQRHYSGRALFVVDMQGRLVYQDLTPTPDEVPSHDAALAALERLKS